MMVLSAGYVADLRRWFISGAIIVLAHGGMAAAMVGWRDEIEPAEPAAAIVIEFAPMPAAPAMPQANIAPGPEQVMSDASPNRPVETLEEKQKVQQNVASRPAEEPPPQVKPAPNPEVAVDPPREVQQETARQAPRLPAPTTSAPQAIPERTAALPAAPMQGQIAPQNSSVLVAWRSQIVAVIERNKRYPETSARRGEHGVAQVFFSLDRQGRLIDSRIVRSSGASALDEEALGLLRRAPPRSPRAPRNPRGPRQL